MSTVKLYATMGNDFIGGGSALPGTTLVEIYALGGNDTVNLNAPVGDVDWRVFGGAGDDTMMASSAFADTTLFGGDGSDRVMVGGQFSAIPGTAKIRHVADGGAGDDILEVQASLWSGATDVTLRGGSGFDIFRINARGQGSFEADTRVEIADFVQGTDRIDLVFDSVFGPSAGVAPDIRNVRFTQVGSDVRIEYSRLPLTASYDPIYDANIDIVVKNASVTQFDDSDFTFNGVSRKYLPGTSASDLLDAASFGEFDEVYIAGLGGNDTIDCLRPVDLFTADGGAGSDVIRANSASSALLLGGDGNDTIWGGSDFNGSGPIGLHRVSGGAGADRLIVYAQTKGSVDLEGGPNDPFNDRFVFQQSGGGQPLAHRVLDFQDGIDLIEFQGDHINAFSDLLITQVGSNVRLSVAPGTAASLFGDVDITLLNANALSLTAADFVFS